MSAPYAVLSRPELDEPMLVVQLAGWIDAGAAATAAMTSLISATSATTIVRFDDDRFIDYRARRPVMELRDGVNTGLVWPTIELKHGRTATGRDVLLLTGHEPDAAWHAFLDAVAGLAVELGTAMMIGLGAYPFATPHTRPSRLSITAATPELAASLPYLRNSLDVPAGIEAALERALADRQVPAVGLWAQVPHYASNYPYPPASLALLQGLADVAGVVIDLASLTEEADAHRRRLDELVANSAEHVAMLQQLERVYDEEVAAGGTPPIPLGPLPTGDELAAQLERFLREQGG